MRTHALLGLFAPKQEITKISAYYPHTMRDGIFCHNNTARKRMSTVMFSDQTHMIY